MDSLTLLLMTHILRYMPTPQHHAYVCSAGSEGYHALKEMLQNGVPGNTLLIESKDLRKVVTLPEAGATDGSGDLKETSSSKPSAAEIGKPPCCLLYTFDHTGSLQGPHGFIPEHIPRVTVYTNMTTLPGKVLANSIHLKTIDLSAVTHITTTIGEFFMCECKCLEEIDITPLRDNIEEIEGAFLEECCSLKRIDLAPLSKVRLLGEYFLGKCTGLTSIDLSPLSNVTEIKKAFLVGCVGLKEIDLSPLSNVTVVGVGFLHGCSGITAIDISPFHRLTAIQDNFLAKCSGLEMIDLSPLKEVTEIGWLFLDDCSGLKVIDLSLSTALGAVPEGLLKWASGDAITVILPPHLEQKD